MRERAEKLGISNAEVARRCGLGERQYAYYTAGTREPNLQALVKIANVLGTTPDVLLGVEDALPFDRRRQLLDRLSASASELAEDVLEIVVIQTDALAGRRDARGLSTGDAS